jgi:hypothetical protein
VQFVGGSRPASQSKIPLSAEGANEEKVKIDNRLRRLANFTYLARLFDANTPRNGTYTEFDFSTISSRYFHYLQRI